MNADDASSAAGLPMLTPGPWQGAAFVALAVVMALALRWTLRMPLRLWAAMLAWQVAMGALALNGYFQHFDEPWRALPTLALGIAAVGWLSSRPFAGSGLWLTRAPDAAWIVVQSFRLPLEFWLYSLFSAGVIGPHMTFASANPDIAVGLSAPLLAALVQRQKWRGPVSPGLRWLLLAWNVMGLMLLLNVVVIAVLSTPFAFRVFTDGPANRFIAVFPFIWLPTLLVPLALMAHIVSLRRTWALRFHPPLPARA